MIQLATDPHASRPNWRPAAADAKDEPVSQRRSRSGHAWPFISRHVERASVPQESKRAPAESGS
jgi:hypothetical protein